MKTYTIAVTKDGKTRTIAGTLEELVAHFRNILESANSLDRSVNPAPKTIKGLMANLRKAKAVDGNNYSTKGKIFTLVG